MNRYVSAVTDVKPFSLPETWRSNLLMFAFGCYMQLFGVTLLLLSVREIEVVVEGGVGKEAHVGEEGVGG